MKTLRNLVFLFIATAGTALAQTRGNSGPARPHNGYDPARPAFQKGLNYVVLDYCRAPSRHEDGFGGQAALIDAAARFNYLASLARTNDLQAQRLAMENQRQKAEDQLQLRKMRAETREAENQKRMALIRRQNAARPRAAQPANVVSPLTGTIAWPTLLRDASYSHYRALVGQVLQQQDRTGQLSVADSRQITQMTAEILEELKADIQNVRPQDYVAVKSFARGLLAKLRSQPSPNDGPRVGGQVAQAKFAGE
jgi:hypothetical protein